MCFTRIPGNGSATPDSYYTKTTRCARMLVAPDPCSRGMTRLVFTLLPDDGVEMPLQVAGLRVCYSTNPKAKYLLGFYLHLVLPRSWLQREGGSIYSLLGIGGHTNKSPFVRRGYFAKIANWVVYTIATSFSFFALSLCRTLILICMVRSSLSSMNQSPLRETLDPP